MKKAEHRVLVSVQHAAFNRDLLEQARMLDDIAEQWARVKLERPMNRTDGFVIMVPLREDFLYLLSSITDERVRRQIGEMVASQVRAEIAMNRFWKIGA